jgi:hypothetical protein
MLPAFPLVSTVFAALTLLICGAEAELFIKPLLSVGRGRAVSMGLSMTLGRIAPLS